MEKGKLFLIPTHLTSAADERMIAPLIREIILNTNHYLVENVRTARRFMSSLHCTDRIDASHFEILDKNTLRTELSDLMQPVLSGKDMGLMSEAGLPGIADPGAAAVSFAHKNGVQVVPLPGASSIFMTLMASGFNGQSFSFHGYVPIETDKRIAFLKKLETEVYRNGASQVFMETPYRNVKLLETMLHCLKSDTFLCIGADVTGSNELILARSIREWKINTPKVHKIPAIFVLGTPVY
jgi:16S rRNA (cytidine1402-2'-O)-methyltransferase